MTEPVIVHLEEFHLNEIFPDSLPPEAVASLVSFPSFAMEYGEKTLAAGGAIQLARAGQTLVTYRTRCRTVPSSYFPCCTAIYRNSVIRKLSSGMYLRR